MSLSKETLRNLLLYEFELNHDATTAANNINRAKRRQVVTDRTAQRWFKRFREEGTDNLADHVRSIERLLSRQSNWTQLWQLVIWLTSLDVVIHRFRRYWRPRARSGRRPNGFRMGLKQVRCASAKKSPKSCSALLTRLVSVWLPSLPITRAFPEQEEVSRHQPFAPWFDFFLWITGSEVLASWYRSVTGEMGENYPGRWCILRVTLLSIFNCCWPINFVILIAPTELIGRPNNMLFQYWLNID